MIGYTYPDFLLKDDCYPSPTILGILYRTGLQFKRDNPDRIKGGKIDDHISSSVQV